MSEQKIINLEILSNDDYEFEDEYEEQEYEDSKKINWARVIEYANTEKDFLENLLEFAELRIIEEVTDGKDPDPKINAIIVAIEWALSISFHLNKAGVFMRVIKLGSICATFTCRA